MGVPVETTVNNAPEQKNDRPRYEQPRIQVMTEREILNTFQITQSMMGWWTTGGC
jgi:hypothetical protein